MLVRSVFLNVIFGMLNRTFQKKKINSVCVYERILMFPKFFLLLNLQLNSYENTMNGKWLNSFCMENFSGGQNILKYPRLVFRSNWFICNVPDAYYLQNSKRIE